MRAAMFNEVAINLLDLVISVSTAVDLVAPKVGGHHKRVAYMALAIARMLGWPSAVRQDVGLAGLLHDIGALSLSERHRLLTFDDDDPSNHVHGEIAYLLLRKFQHFEKIADVVRHHHVSWEDQPESIDLEAAEMAQLLHLADRIDTLILRDQPVLSQVDRITATVSRQSGTMFRPEHVEAFMELAWREYFWLDVVSPSLDQLIHRSAQNFVIDLDGDDLQDFAELMAHIIDFRSRFTATHSSGVAAVAGVLASLVGFSASECEKVKVAGYLHDIGKLAIPPEILEKPGKLNRGEFQVIKSHAYHTYNVLAPINGMEDVAMWAALHHERLDGNGYPGRRPGHQIPLGARIIAVADMFTALSEDRPYRGSVPQKAVRDIAREMGDKRILDASVIDILLSNYDEVDCYRRHAQEAAAGEYDTFLHALGENERLAMQG